MFHPNRNFSIDSEWIHFKVCNVLVFMLVLYKYHVGILSLNTSPSPLKQFVSLSLPMVQSKCWLLYTSIAWPNKCCVHQRIHLLQMDMKLTSLSPVRELKVRTNGGGSSLVSATMTWRRRSAAWVPRLTPCRYSSSPRTAPPAAWRQLHCRRTATSATATRHRQFPQPSARRRTSAQAARQRSMWAPESTWASRKKVRLWTWTTPGSCWW